MTEMPSELTDTVEKTPGIVREPFETYRKNAAQYLTSHQLADFRRCPELFRRKKLGLIQDEDRPAYLIGRAVHAWMLEGREVFDRQFAVGGPVNPRTGKPYGANTQAFQEWAAAQGKPVLTPEQFSLIESIVGGTTAHVGVRDLLSVGTPEAVVRADYFATPCQI